MKISNANRTQMFIRRSVATGLAAISLQACNPLNTREAQMERANKILEEQIEKTKTPRALEAEKVLNCTGWVLGLGSGLSVMDRGRVREALIVQGTYKSPGEPTSPKEVQEAKEFLAKKIRRIAGVSTREVNTSNIVSLYQGQTEPRIPVESFYNNPATVYGIFKWGRVNAFVKNAEIKSKGMQLGWQKCNP